MTPITYVAASDTPNALASLDGETGRRQIRFIAGGTNLIDLMKADVMRPMTLVDINALPFAGIAATETHGILLGALARNADTAYHPLVRRRYPVLSAAILAGASAQIRNLASNGGNLLQRTRCLYFYDTATPCNKREPGTGCSAFGGLTRGHAILGASEHCVATHPSDMCVALAALDAIVHVESAQRGARAIPFHEFHRLPGDRPEDDVTLAPDELITSIELPDADRFARHSAYLKVRDRTSYAFALVSVAALLDLDTGIGHENDNDNDKTCTIREARVALGGVAHKPWRLPDAEALLAGKAPTPEHFDEFARALLEGARGLGGNDFKIPLAQRAIVRALTMARDGRLGNAVIERENAADGGTP